MPRIQVRDRRIIRISGARIGTVGAGCPGGGCCDGDGACACPNGAVLLPCCCPPPLGTGECVGADVCACHDAGPCCAQTGRPYALPLPPQVAVTAFAMREETCSNPGCNPGVSGAVTLTPGLAAPVGGQTCSSQAVRLSGQMTLTTVTGPTCSDSGDSTSEAVVNADITLNSLGVRAVLARISAGGGQLRCWWGSIEGWIQRQFAAIGYPTDNAANCQLIGGVDGQPAGVTATHTAQKIDCDGTFTMSVTALFPLASCSTGGGGSGGGGEAELGDEEVFL